MFLRSTEKWSSGLGGSGNLWERDSMYPVIISPVVTPAIIPAVKVVKPVIVRTVPVMVLRIVGSMVRSVILVSTSVSIMDPVTRIDSVARRRGAAGPTR